MKPFLTLSLLLALLSSCDSDDNLHADIPSVVLNSFNREYSQASEVDWNEREQAFEVKFELSGRDHAAVINVEGKIVSRKREISINDIPEQVFSSLNKHFDRNHLDDPELVQHERDTFYQLELNKFLFDEKVVLDNNGKVDKNIPYWD